MLCLGIKLRAKRLRKKCFCIPAFPQRLEAAVDLARLTARVKLVPFPFVVSSGVIRQPARKTPFHGGALLAVVLAVVASLGQTNPSPPSLGKAQPESHAPAAVELPVIMRQKMVAGSTPVGTKVQAKLTVATMVNGAVVPEDAILSGEVVESVAKSHSAPSRLAIRMDSVQWKSGSAPIKLYLTAWYYPMEMASQDISSGLPDAGNDPRLRTGGAYPGARNPSSPFPNTDNSNARTVPTPSSAPGISQHRMVMKDVESTRSNDGAITLTSTHANIKLDKSTTYVFAGAP